MLDDQGHRKATGMPAAGDNAAPTRATCNYSIDMEWLRIEVTCELEDVHFLDPAHSGRNDVAHLELSESHAGQ